MRRFLVAFAILTVLVLCQNVTSGTAIPAPQETPDATEPVGGAVVTQQAGLTVGGRTPEPMPLLLMMVGLSGLTVAGNRTEAEPEAARA